MPVELRLLRYFTAVAEEGHVGHAAARLFISQPALSQQIRALEDQVGVPLFTRHPRGVELTEAGEVLLAEAREVLARADRLDEAVDQLGRGETAGLRVGIPPGLDPGVLPGIVASLRDAHPEARIEVREMTTPEQLEALGGGSLDFGLVREPIEDTRLSRRTLLVEQLGVCLPATHPLTTRESLTLRELADQLFVCFPRAWAPALHNVLIDAMRDRDMEARIEPSEQLGTTVGKVAAGEGITLAPAAWLEEVPGIVWRPLTDPEIQVRTAAAWRASNRSPLLHALVDLLPDAAETGAPVRKV
jgi:DNA-binding transcriptional LysR family regulator